MLEKIILFSTMLFLMNCSQKEVAQKTPPLIELQQSGVDVSFRGLGVKNENEAWVSGTKGTVLRTQNAGKSWEKITVPGADTLDFRDLELLNDSTVLLMSIGPGSSSKIFKSTNHGDSWSVTYENKEPKAFFDGFDFWDEKNGILISDAIDDKLYLLITEDGGESWNRVGAETLPPLGEGEYGFAASGTGIFTLGDQEVWIATGGSKARVFYSPDRGKNWEVFNSPMISGKPSTGSFSIHFQDKLNGIIVGGDYQIDTAAINNVALTKDGGKTWNSIENPGTVPFKSCVTFVGDDSYLAVGTSGVSWSSDNGKNWTTVNPTSFHTMDFDRNSNVGWMAGGGGKIAKFQVK